MRTPVLALFSDLSDDDVYALAVLSSQVTHGHPLSHFTAGLAPVLVQRLAARRADIRSGQHVLDLAADLAAKWAGDNATYQEWARQVANLAAGWSTRPEVADICDIAGEGWIATECLLTALVGCAIACVQRETSVFGRLQPLTNTRGDTDSLACVGGWMIGALLGLARDDAQDILEGLEPDYRQWFIEHCPCAR